ncbi:MAG TPA: family 10 glycosylhydrolase [Dyella sp.]|uniref:family 10 glycosylhydrolase n=1 Tax=Dyella sp. TaxID=1869338 RepID=UPI002C5CBFEC|nr:family 10 glycosylhydrolase [Dyella sp.]HUB92055.1 family 10 glycosylhydrolase [Dyella sp.]
MHRQKNEELRASWVASTLNLDWPSKASLSIQNDTERTQVQKSDLKILDEIKELHMDIVIFQVKPCADALYRSDILPWSSYLTGALGKSPGFDPLEFAIDQAHARGIKLHAWLNPQRVSMDTRSSTIDELNASSPSLLQAFSSSIRNG